MFVCLVFYAILTAFQLYNGASSQIHAFLDSFNQYLTSPLYWHWKASRSAIPIILNTKEEGHYSSFDKLCNDGKTLQDYMRNEQWSHGCKTHT